MEFAEFKALAPDQKILAALIALVNERGGKMIVTSGMVADVRRGTRISWEPDAEFDKLVWLTANQPRR